MEETGRKIYYLAFTERGFGLAKKLASLSGGEAFLSGQAGGVHRWTARFFSQADGLVYIGAAGIAVRAIAPFIKSKTTDPAVIVIDECGSFVIPVLSGHLGGANDLAKELAVLTEGVPVITTATDVSGRFAVDEWAKRQQCLVKDPKKIVRVSSKILSGREIWIRSDWPVAGEAPEYVRLIEDAGGTPEPVQPAIGEAYGSVHSIAAEKEEGSSRVEETDVVVSIWARPKRADKEPDKRSDQNSDKILKDDDNGGGTLRLVPRIAVLGIGCRRGTEASYLESCFRLFLEETELEEGAVCAVASIDLKKDEPGLLQFCRDRNLPLEVFSAEQLLAVQGDFTASPFVKKITGVDNVCERSAVCASEGGELLVRKTVYDGVTMALAVKPYHPDWKWT